MYPSRNAAHILFHEILVGRFAKMIHCIEGKALFETGSTLAECGRLRCFFSQRLSAGIMFAHANPAELGNKPW